MRSVSCEGNCRVAEAVNLSSEQNEKPSDTLSGFLRFKSAINTTLPGTRPGSVVDPVHGWFHDIFYADGTPYRQAEIEAICAATKSA
jgi:hypothetical protein